MIRPIMRNQPFLAMPSEAATIEDAPVGQDLLDTLEAHAHECVGMAANMIGVRKRIIVFDDNGTAKLMFNPEIVHASSEYSAEEGCLSLVGQRPCRRYRKLQWLHCADYPARNRSLQRDYHLGVYRSVFSRETPPG